MPNPGTEKEEKWMMRDVQKRINTELQKRFRDLWVANSG